MRKFVSSWDHHVVVGAVIDVVLDPVVSDVSGEAAGSGHPGGSPVHRGRHSAKLVPVSSSRIQNRVETYGHGPQIRDAGRLAGVRHGVVVIGEGCGNPVAVDQLVPVEEADPFHTFEEDLGGAKV